MGERLRSTTPDLKNDKTAVTLAASIEAAAMVETDKVEAAETVAEGIKTPD